MDSLKNFLASSAQEVQYAYARNQLQGLKTASWSNNAYGWTPPAPGTQSFTANGLNQYTAAGGSALSYDASGNLAGDGTWLYGYDNRLTSAARSAAPAVSAALGYDAQGRLRQTTIGSAGLRCSMTGRAS